MTDTAPSTATLPPLSDKDELSAWKEVHRHLREAIIVQQEAVAVARAQRNYWCEEIAANITPEGKLDSSSVWLKPVPLKKGSVKKKKPVKKRKAEDEDEADETAPSPSSGPLKKRRPAKKRPVLTQDDDEEEDNESDRNVLRLTLSSSATKTPTDAYSAVDHSAPAPYSYSAAGAMETTEQQGHPHASSYQYAGHHQMPRHWASSHQQASLHPAAVAAANPEHLQMMQQIPEHLRPFLAAAQTASMNAGMPLSGQTTAGYYQQAYTPDLYGQYGAQPGHGPDDDDYDDEEEE